MAKTLISLKDVWKTYKMGENEVHALTGISLDIHKGDFIAITGPSGSGKSTMMNIVGCLDTPTNGTVLLDGKNITELSESELAQARGKTIGFVFQQFNLIPTLTATENVTLPLEFQETETKNARKKAIELLNIVGLKDRADHLPSQLSGGQMQRVAIARALATNPEIILADEPTGNLDSKTGAFIMQFLKQLNTKDGKTIILVTHDRELVKYASSVAHIKDGKIERIEHHHKRGIQNET